MRKKQTYFLDNSAIIHLAAIRKGHTNTFRIALTLTEIVNPDVLQLSLDRVVVRFPTIAAGIRTGFLRHTVVPVNRAPRVMRVQGGLTCMDSKEIKRCAFRVLYSDKQIIGEFFHSLTDGYGGFVFMQTLLAEYLHLLHNIAFTNTPMILDVSETPKTEELRDDYITYAGKCKAEIEHRKVYQLPGNPRADNTIRTTTRIYDSEELLGLAHYYDVSLTTLLATVMIMSVAEVQNKYSATEKVRKPIQIMVPANLRKLYPSKSLRNFSLYALPCLESGEWNGFFESLLFKIEKQLNEQITKENMSAVMATHTKLEQSFFVRTIPWFIKKFVLKIAHRFWGEQNSCITMSNMGEMSLPKEMEQFVEQIDVFLTPRITSPYNCGIISYGGKCTINFARRCEEPELEDYFYDRLSKLLQSS